MAISSCQSLGHRRDRLHPILTIAQMTSRLVLLAIIAAIVLSVVLMIKRTPGPVTGDVEVASAEPSLTGHLASKPPPLRPAGKQSTEDSLNSPHVATVFATGTIGTTSNSVVLLLEQYSLPTTPEMVEVSINALRDVVLPGKTRDDLLRELDERVVEIQHDTTLSEEDRQRELRYVGFQRIAYNTLFTDVLSQTRKIGAEAVTAKLGHPAPDYINDLYTKVPLPSHTEFGVR
jgi:hypothetical protein